VENPANQKTIESKLGISPATVNKFINKDLQRKLVHKPQGSQTSPRDTLMNEIGCMKNIWQVRNGTFL